MSELTGDLRTWLPASEVQLLETVTQTADDELVRRILGGR